MKSAFPGPDPGAAGEGPIVQPTLGSATLTVKLRGLILWRLVFLSVLLLLTVILREQEKFFGFPSSFSPFYILIALQFSLSLVYLFLLLQEKAEKGSAVFQLAVDGLFVTAVVYLTGGIESLFSFLYFLVILAGGVLFYRSGGLWTAFYAFVAYASLLILQGSGLIPYYYGRPGRMPAFSHRYMLYLMVMNGIGFFFVGYLGSLFSEQTRRQQDQIEQQKKNIIRLEEWSRLVVENLDMGLLTLDRKRRVLTVNPAGEKILRRTADELIGRPLSDFFLLEGEEEKNHFEGEEQRMETRYVCPDGSPLVIGFTLYKLREEAAKESDIGTIVSFKDISKIKDMEERLRRMDRLALMGRMAAGIAHEIRNPLASISGSLQLFREFVPDQGTGDRLLSIASRELSKLDQLINDFLTFSRPAQSPPQLLNVTELIEDTVELFKKNKELSPGIRLRVELEPDLLLKIPGGELSQVLWNLLTNALHALAGEGEISIQAAKVLTPEGGGHLEILIRDTGSGIPEEDLTHIFDPFFTTKEKGTGLGLCIVQKIVSDYGGRISVESRIGEGSTFSLQFPLP